MLLLRHGESRTMTDKVGCHLPGIYRFPYKKEWRKEWTGSDESRESRESQKS